MATVNQLERLKALVDRLLPLADRARGEVIAADDWNTLVGAALETARAVVGEGTDTSVPPHEHLDQVTLAWLDPRLRAMIERGPLADPAATSRVSAVERSAALSLQQLDQLTAQVRDLRAATGRAETNDLDRKSALITLTRKLDGLTDPRDEIATLRNSLDAIGTNVAAVSSFAAGLANVSPAQLLAGLAKVDQLQERLTTPTGALLDVAEFERQLTDLRATLVTEDELTAAIGGIHVDLSDSVRDNLLEASKAAAARQAETSAGALTEALRAQVTSQIQEVAQSAVAAAKEATGQFRAEVQDAITTALRGDIAAGDANVRGAIRPAVDAANATLKAQVEQRVAALEGSLGDRVSAALTRATPELLATFNTALNTQLGDLTGQITSLQGRVREVGAALAATTTDLAALRQSTAAALADQIAAVKAANAAALAAAVTDLRNAQSSALDSVRAEIAAERGRVTGALEDVRRSIPPRGISREELNAALNSNNDQLRSDLTTRFNSDFEVRLQNRLGGGGGVGRIPFNPVFPPG